MGELEQGLKQRAKLAFSLGESVRRVGWRFSPMQPMEI